MYIYRPGTRKPKTAQDTDHGVPPPPGPYVCTCAYVDMHTSTYTT